MSKLFWFVPVVGAALLFLGFQRDESTTEFVRTAPQPLGITAALLQDARYVDAREAGRDNLPLPRDGKGPLVAVGTARDAEKIGARWFVPAETLLRTTALSFQAPNMEITPRQLWQRRQEFHIIDVREIDEFKSSHVPGSTRQSMFDDFPRDKPVALFCLTGHRSAAIVAQLKQRGFQNLRSVSGGWLDWQRQNLPLETR